MGLSGKDDELRRPITRNDSLSSDQEIGRSRVVDGFQGKNTLCCKGKIVMAKNLWVFILTNILTLLPCILFLIFDAAYLWLHVSPALPIFMSLIFIFTMSTLWFAALVDPGIIPRSTEDEAEFYICEEEKRKPRSSDDVVKPLGSTSGASSVKAMRSHTIYINNLEVSIKWCYSCKLWRPPRASHCSQCNNCIDGFDHHCPWVANCVGRRNYRYFYCYLVGTVLLTAIVFAGTCVHLSFLTDEKGTLSKAVSANPSCVPTLTISGGAFFAVFGMLIYHSYLVSFYLTTSEEIKGYWSPISSNRVSTSPFTHGNFMLNFLAIMCAPRYPRLLFLDRFVDQSQAELRDVQPLYGSTTSGGVQTSLEKTTKSSEDLQPNEAKKDNNINGERSQKDSRDTTQQTPKTGNEPNNNSTQDRKTSEPSGIDRNQNPSTQTAAAPQVESGDKSSSKDSGESKSHVSEGSDTIVEISRRESGKESLKQGAGRSRITQTIKEESDDFSEGNPGEQFIDAPQKPYEEVNAAKKDSLTDSEARRFSTSFERHKMPRESLETGYTLTSSALSASGTAAPRKKSVTIPEIKTSTQNTSDWTWPSSDHDRIRSPDKLHPDYEPEDEFKDSTSSSSTTPTLETTTSTSSLEYHKEMKRRENKDEEEDSATQDS